MLLHSPHPQDLHFIDCHLQFHVIPPDTSKLAFDQSAPANPSITLILTLISQVADSLDDTDQPLSDR
jgi:hypothetical protein